MRLLGFLWPVVFFVPLSEFAGRYCWLTGIDPVYHTLVFTHEYMPQILLVYAVISTLIVITSDARTRRQLRHLATLAAPTPRAIEMVLRDEAAALGMSVPACAYLDVPQSFCFTANGDQRVMLSHAFATSLPLDELRLALRHELVHLKRSHPAKAFAWRVGTRALLLPGFEAVERWRHAHREEIADRETAGKAVDRYRQLLVRSSLKNGPQTAVLSWRLSALEGRRPALSIIWPALVAGVLLAGLISSHVIFMENIQYLIAHHC